ncbi:recombinase family protein [Labedaea rhizosphaerae]|uniref:DNA invertase Pin-like site-specific DNA recombinase n=1 Tax=Labedaea rhizosphaerae TaxID=598644 RepID=A0A4R6SHE5_LABRH|nr:recombinase family protein [Labedaea rhizosphaerae]TDQ01225.1 DNA invertase Pin-like site-specific DNA recombinase [Labedaea rhizosphaerae]
MNKLVGIYLRISDDREGRELGVQRQEEDCRKLVARKGDTVVAVYKDNDISASTRSKKVRKDYNRLIADAKAGFVQEIVAYTSGRLTRRPMEHEGQIELAEHYGVTFDYVASPSFDLNTAAGRMIARVLAARDAAEAEEISERVRREKEQAREVGEWTGGARPFGYEGAQYDEDGVITNKRRVGRALVPREAKMIKDAVQRVIAGESLLSICEDWTARGLPTPREAPAWYPSTLRSILKRGRNAGLVEDPDGRIRDGVTGTWRSIITVDEWQAVCKILNDPSRRTYHGTRTLKWLGSNLYVCGLCGSLMRSSGRTSQGPVGVRLATYRCKRSSHCQARAQGTDDAVLAVARALLRKYGGDLLKAPVDDSTIELRNEANALRVRLEELEDMYGDGEISRAGLIRQKAKLDTRLGSIEARLSQHAEDAVLYSVVHAPDPAAVFDVQPISRKRAIVDTLMTVTIEKGRKGRLPAGVKFDGSRITIVPREGLSAA